VDRAAAERFIELVPEVPRIAKANRQFLARCVRFLAQSGVRQFIDLGAGLPTAPNTHVTAQQASPGAAVAYVDNDPVVISHLTALLAHHGDRVAVVPGDLHDQEAILSAAGLRAVIDLGAPVCVIMGMILHFDTADAAAGLVKRYMSAVAPGSYLIATIASGKGVRAAEFYQTYNASGFAAMYNHSSADFASFFHGMEIIPPGLGDTRRIHPGWSKFTAAPKRPDRIVAGIARV
jgi:O-methyltransferase involved in polyketide biosynthesis